MWVRDILEEQGRSVLANTDEQSDFPKRKLEEGYWLGESTTEIKDKYGLTELNRFQYSGYSSDYLVVKSRSCRSCRLAGGCSFGLTC